MFKVGQKVVCIKGIDELKQNEIYTIKWVGLSSIGIPAVSLYEVEPPEPHFTKYLAERFRPIDDVWVDELLCKLLEEVEAEELVSA